jgi:protein subunit release factor B
MLTTTKNKVKKDPLFSVTADDCDWSYTRGTGNGGQKKNKTSSAVHCRHRSSGAYGYSESSRSQLDNRRDAFRKMSETKEFQQWVNLEFMKRSGQLLEIERSVEQELQKVKLEIKIDGKWTEVQPHQLVDNPEDFVLEIVV